MVRDEPTDCPLSLDVLVSSYETKRRSVEEKGSKEVKWCTVLVRGPLTPVIDSLVRTEKKKRKVEGDRGDTYESFRITEIDDLRSLVEIGVAVNRSPKFSTSST